MKKARTWMMTSCLNTLMAVAVTDMALQVFGGYGYSKEYPVERMLRDSRGWPVAGGTMQIQRVNIDDIVKSRILSFRGVPLKRDDEKSLMISGFLP
ncbi:MAG: hypothetical protein JW943_14825, partial [Deltaproteobacteria bacterium]|nr:hypothetical protein [Deltaproteobacteria bacterium]